MISKENSEHYQWADGCDGWHLVKSKNLSVILEEVSPGGSEIMHYHCKSEQFFFVLDGIATLVVDGVTHTIKPQEGFHIKSGVSHQLQNNHSKNLSFIVTSTPPSHGDRVEL
ncbi:MAG: cupin domain-containing protein [bacterium]